MKDAINDRIGEVVIMEDRTPALGMLVGGEDHRALPNVPLVDDVKKDIRRVIAVGQVSDLIDDEQVRLEIASKDLPQVTVTACVRQIVNQVGGCREEHVEAVLQGSVGDCDGQVGLAPSGLAFEDHGATLGNEIGAEERANGRPLQGGLKREVNLLKGAQEGESRRAYSAREAGTASMGDLLGEQGVEQLLIGPLLFLGALDELPPHAASIGEVQAFEEGLEVVAHDRPPRASARP